MVSSGAIDATAAERAKSAPVTINNALEIKETFGLYFKEQVRRELVERFGWQRVYQGGLRVYTTLDSDVQKAAETLLEEGLQDIERRPGFKHAKRAAQSDRCRRGAHISPGRADGHGSHRTATSRRWSVAATSARVTSIAPRRRSGSRDRPSSRSSTPPPSKPGYSPASVITGLNDPILTVKGAWLPEDDHSDGDEMTMRAALRTSSNRAAVQMLASVGIPKAVGYAEKLNVGKPPSVPSLALGASDVTLSALTAAYGAFADGGIVRTPILIRRVEDSDGVVLYTEEGKSQRAVSEATAFLMASMLSDVISAGTGFRARQTGFSLPAAGKTGTTNDYNDAWFVGFTPHLVTGVWVGFDQPQTIASGGYAGELAVPIWGAFMKRATRGDKPDWFERPADVDRPQRLPHVRTAAGGRLRQCVGARPRRPWSKALDGLHRVLRPRHRTHRNLSAPQSFVHRSPGRHFRQGGRRAGLGRRMSVCRRPPPARRVHRRMRSVAFGRVPAREGKVEEPKKKRGFWARVFGARRRRAQEGRRTEEGRRAAEGGQAPHGGQPPDDQRRHAVS